MILLFFLDQMKNTQQTIQATHLKLKKKTRCRVLVFTHIFMCGVLSYLCLHFIFLFVCDTFISLDYADGSIHTPKIVNRLHK